MSIEERYFRCYDREGNLVGIVGGFTIYDAIHQLQPQPWGTFASVVEIDISKLESLSPMTIFNSTQDQMINALNTTGMIVLKGDDNRVMVYRGVKKFQVVGRDFRITHQTTEQAVECAVAKMQGNLEWKAVQ